MTASDADGGWTLTLFIEPAGKRGGDAKAARTFYFARMKRNPIAMTHVARAEPNTDVAVVEYDQGMAGVSDHSANAYLSRGGCWLDVHIFKTGFDPAKDWTALDAILTGIKLDPPTVAGK